MNKILGRKRIFYNLLVLIMWILCIDTKLPNRMIYASYNETIIYGVKVERRCYVHFIENDISFYNTWFKVS